MTGLCQLILFLWKSRKWQKSFTELLGLKSLDTVWNYKSKKKSVCRYSFLSFSFRKIIAHKEHFLPSPCFLPRLFMILLLLLLKKCVLLVQILWGSSLLSEENSLQFICWCVWVKSYCLNNTSLINKHPFAGLSDAFLSASDSLFSEKYFILLWS